MMVENFESFKNLQYWIRKKLRKTKTYNFFLLQRSALSNALGGAMSSWITRMLGRSEKPMPWKIRTAMKHGPMNSQFRYW